MVFSVVKSKEQELTACFYYVYIETFTAVHAKVPVADNIGLLYYYYYDCPIGILHPPSSPNFIILTNSFKSKLKMRRCHWSNNTVYKHDILKRYITDNRHSIVVAPSVENWVASSWWWIDSFLPARTILIPKVLITILGRQTKTLLLLLDLQGI